MPDYIKVAKSVLKNTTIRRMPTSYKLFWFYIMTHCDQSGVWIVDWDEASYYLGEKIDPETAKSLFLTTDDGSEVPKCLEFDKGRKWLIPKFAKYQVSGIKNNGNWVKSIKGDWVKHGIDPETLLPFEKKPSDTLIEPLANPLVNPSVTLKEGLDKTYETLKEDLPKTPLILSNLISTNTESIDNSESSIISIGGMQGGNYEPNFWENFYNDFQKAYGAYGYPWKKWEVIDHLRGAVANVLGKWKEMNIQGDYHDAAEFLTQCAALAQQADTNAKRDKRKAPHNWLADHNYLTNPADILPKKKTESELLREAITKAAQNIKQP